jgi:hypothetical protein
MTTFRAVLIKTENNTGKTTGEVVTSVLKTVGPWQQTLIGAIEACKATWKRDFPQTNYREAQDFFW